jgi:hypothetical protein
MASLLNPTDLVYAFEFIKRICVEIGPGSPCSPKERARADAVKAEMEKTADAVRDEPFTCAPEAFLKWFQFASVLIVIAAVFFQLGLRPQYALIFTTVSLGIAVYVFLIMIFEFFLFREFIDWLFPKKPSENIIGIFRPFSRRNPAPIKRGKPGARKPKRILIFGAHHDSALRFNYLWHFKNGYFVVEGILIFGLALFTAGMLLRWLALACAWPMDWIAPALQWYMWISLPITIFIDFTFTEWGRGGGSVPGAIDNLSAVSILLMIGRVLKRNPSLRPADTEIRLISFGSEEAGTRGSRAYVCEHLAELQAADAVLVNMDTIYDPEIEIFTSDRNGTIRNSPAVVEALDRAADAVRVPHVVSPFPFAGGGTDALAFREKNIRASTLFSMKIPSQMVRFYHQPSDNYDIVNPESLRHAALIALEFIKNF